MIRQDDRKAPIGLSEKIMFFTLPILLIVACILNKVLFLTGVRKKAYTESNEANDANYTNIDDL